MGFFDLFRPKWKHSDVEVRSEAVRALDAEDLTVLAQIVRLDKDVRVRRLALKKIDDPDLLGELASQDPDEGLRKDAAAKAAELLLDDAAGSDEERAKTALDKVKSEPALADVARRSPLASVRELALRRVSDEKSLADVAKKANDGATRLAAVTRLHDSAALRDVAIADAQKDVALAALAKVTDEKALEQVAGRAKLKVVKKAARDRISALHDAARAGGKTPAERRSEMALLCRTVEEAAASDDWTHAEAAVQASKTSWAALENGQAKSSGDEPLIRRFERALTKFNLRREEAQRRSQALAALETQKRAAAQRDKEKPAPAADEEDEALRAIVESAGVRPSGEEKARRDAERAQREAERATRQAEKDAELKERERESQENLARFEDVTARLESLVGSDNKKVVEAALRSARDIVGAARNLPKAAEAVRTRYDSARAKLVGQLEELRQAEDWKRWANVPRLESLCVRVEALLAAAESVVAPVEVAPVADGVPTPIADAVTAPVAEVAEAAAPTEPAKDVAPPRDLLAELKALQAEWKTVGAAPKEKSETLWKRFKEAADLVYQKSRGQKVVQKEERAANGEKKEALCVRAEELAKQPDDAIHFKETAEQLKALQSEWKTLGPAATRAESDALWKRFRTACDSFFDRRKAHFVERDESHAVSEKALEELCEKAEKLANPTAHADWRAAAELMKQYQADWKAASASGKHDALWKRFRAACDAFFERRQLHFAAMDGERAENLTKKQALCEKAEAVANAVESQEMTEEEGRSEAKRLQSDWKSIGPVAKDVGDAIWARFRGACDRVFDPQHKVSPEDTAAVAEATGISGFTNKLPLGDLAARLAASKPDESKDKPDENK